ncbi:CCA tRNA nucleotidyltransferase [Sinorhizobium numidicum]|uniref:CCA tRNA nucleotidyltransferase n=1 Tax=Sinorhizobium numidicum TaxID=680248 RepID=A0ABY8CX17_9HYPH|nr:CCA tRNA nucleotidyltransferase [Sinorhizobium numidicum]WEX76532.1 CCA tRNA nucleotidyltransferase [Sinorhizobium numidicum]WEX83193.1 CCA tRNA nucleotidyltransferase [Sinorhizobium numidicum]
MTSVAAEPWFEVASLRRVFELLNVDGGEVRVVGGAIRNSLLGLPVSDVDLATTWRPEEVAARAKAAGIKSVPTGFDHGTITLVVDGTPYEVTTLRRDVATDGRRAEVAFGTDWKADAERRDFTINALYAARDGEVFDYVGGLADVETRTVRFIGNAAERVAEDYLRVLRFFRFFAHYGHGRPDAEGLRACAQARAKLSTLSAERVWGETKKLLSAADPGRALLWMRQAGVLSEILPETEKWGIDAIPGLVTAERIFSWEPDPLLRLAAIVPPDAERLEAMAARLRLSKAEGTYFGRFANAPEIASTLADAALDRLLYRHGTDGIIVRIRLSLASARRKSENDPAFLAETAAFQRLLARAEKWRRPVFPLGGADVLKAGVAAGPKVGELLAELENFWIERNFNVDRATLVARLESMARAG